MKMCEQELIHKIYGQVNILLPAFEMVQKSWNERKQFHECDRYIFMKTTCPWKDHLHTLEKEHKLEGHISFMFY